MELDLPAGFRADPRAMIGAIERASFEADVADEQRGGATGALIAAFRDAGKLSRRLNAVVLNKYPDDARKLAGWAIASPLEAPPIRQQAKGAGRKET